jgi:hypothetical protein
MAGFGVAVGEGRAVTVAVAVAGSGVAVGSRVDVAVAGSGVAVGSRVDVAVGGIVVAVAVGGIRVAVVVGCSWVVVAVDGWGDAAGSVVEMLAIASTAVGSGALMPIGLSNSCKITLVILESMSGCGVAVAWRTWDVPAVGADVAEASSTGPAAGVAVTARKGVAEGEFAVPGLRNAGKESAALFCRAVDRSTPNGNKSPVIAEMSRTTTMIKMIGPRRLFIGLRYLKMNSRVPGCYKLVFG